MKCPKCGKEMLESKTEIKKGILKFLFPCCFFQGRILLDNVKRKVIEVSWLNRKENLN